MYAVNRYAKINNLEKQQVRSLFGYANTSNIAIFVVGLLVVATFIYAGENNHLEWFFIVLILSLSARVAITSYASKQRENTLMLARYYTISSFVIGIDFSIFNLVYYDLSNHDLRIFLSIISFGLITATIASLSVWMKAYLSFVIPQIVSLIVISSINYDVSISIAVIVLFIFILEASSIFNLKLKKELLLAEENIQLTSEIKNEINLRIEVQSELKNQQFKLEDKIKERTLALEEANNRLSNQVGIRREFEKKLEYFAYYDVLTSLPNRTLFIDDVKHALVQAKRNDLLVGVLFVDLDNFKNINDSYGHHVGDELLKEVAVRLDNVLREGDFIARNGGDEFSVLIESMMDAREHLLSQKKSLNL